MKSIIQETLGLKAHRVVEWYGNPQGIMIELVNIPGRRLRCSRCGRKARVRDRLKYRYWRHVPLWGIPVSLIYRPCRVACSQCGIKVEAIPWANGKSCLSLPLMVVLATWSKLLAWQVVARLFHVSWSTVRAAVQAAVAYGLAHRDLDGLAIIGVDEISRRKGHVYHTQVYDLSQKRLLWSGDGRDADALRRFFQELGPDRCAGIQGVCCDMWAPYVEVIREMLPNATLVFDKFHIIRHLLEAVNTVRKEEAAELKKTQPDLLTDTRYIFLKNPENLTDPQRVRLSFLERLNLKINRAYLLKELFKQVWTYRCRGWAKRFLDRWFWWATHSRLTPMRKFAWMLRNHEGGILAWFNIPLTNGATEAMNNNAKAVSHRSRGFRKPATFSLALLHVLGGLELPPLSHAFV